MSPDRVGPIRERRSAAVRPSSACGGGVPRSPGRSGGVRRTAAPRPGRGVAPPAARRGHCHELRSHLGRQWFRQPCRPPRGRLAVLDACRDAANPWLFPDAGPAVVRHQARLRGGEQRADALRRRHGHHRGGYRVAARAFRLYRGPGQSTSTPTSSCATWPGSSASPPAASTRSVSAATRPARPAVAGAGSGAVLEISMGFPTPLPASSVRYW